MPSHKTLNLRLDSEVYGALRSLAESRHLSMNRVVEESILTTVEEDRKQRLREEFTRIAKLPSEETSVDFAFDAQREAALGQD